MSDILKRIHDAEWDNDDVISTEEAELLVEQLKRYRLAAAECAAALMVIETVYGDKFLQATHDQIDLGMRLFSEAVDFENQE